MENIINIPFKHNGQTIANIPLKIDMDKLEDFHKKHSDEETLNQIQNNLDEYIQIGT